MQYRFLYWATLVAAVASFGMALYTLAHNSMIDFYSNVAYVVLSLTIHFDLRINSNERRASCIFLIFYGIVDTVLVFRMDPNSFGKMFLMIFPLLAFVLFGKKRGMILSVIYTVYMLMLMYIVRSDLLTSWAVAMFLLTIVMVASISYLYESTGEMVISELEKTVMELEIQKQKIEEIAIHDELTGLFNRRWFNDQFPKEIQRNRRQGVVLGFFILDVDYFKQYNDYNGHLAGDHALQRVSLILQDQLRRAGDMLFRLGGEEFGGILHAESREKLIATTEQLCRIVEEEKIARKFQNVSEYLTVSIGLVVCDTPEDSRSEDELYKTADEALYRAKENGRNRVCVAD